MSSIASFFSSFVSTVHADSAEPEQVEADVEAVGVAEAEDEEEPEDLLPIIREDCKENRCASLAKHFNHCQEKVHAGQAYKGEDCVEELCALDIRNTLLYIG